MRYDIHLVDTSLGDLQDLWNYSPFQALVDGQEYFEVEPADPRDTDRQIAFSVESAEVYVREYSVPDGPSPADNRAAFVLTLPGTDAAGAALTDEQVERSTALIARQLGVVAEVQVFAGTKLVLKNYGVDQGFTAPTSAPARFVEVFKGLELA